MIRKLLVFLASVGLIILGFMFSIVIIGIGALLGLLAWGYFTWKTRSMRQPKNFQAANENIFDGEATVVDAPQNAGKKLLQELPPRL